MSVRLRIVLPSGEHATCIKSRLWLRDECVAALQDGCLVTLHDEICVWMNYFGEIVLLCVPMRYNVASMSVAL